MSHLSARARRLALASATVITAVAAVPTAHAATRTLEYKCKYPLIGTNAATLTLETASPVAAEAGIETEPTAVSATFTGTGNTSPGLTLIEGLKSVDGSLELASKLDQPSGAVSLPVDVSLLVDSFILPELSVSQLPDPFVLTAGGDVPRLTISEVGLAKLNLERLSLNLTFREANGTPIALPPLTKDIDGNRVVDSDGDFNTFDVLCKLDPGQTADYLTYDVGDLPLPTSPDTTAPSAPGSPSSSDLKANSVKLSWGPSTDEVGGSGLRRYAIRFAGREVRVAPGSTSTVVTGLSPSTPYDFEIVAVDRAGNESSPAHVAVTTTEKPNEGPTPPTALAASVSGHTVSLTWNPSTDDVAVAGYDVYRDDVKVATVTTTSASVADTSTGWHFFRVEAFDAEGVRSTSPSLSVGVASTSGEQTYRCKYPLIGTNPVAAKFLADAPATWPTGELTAPIGLGAELSLGGNTNQGFGLVEGLNSLEGTVIATVAVYSPSGAKDIIKVPLNVAKLTGPLQDPVVLTATGAIPPRTFGNSGQFRFVVENLGMNLKASDAGGAAIELPPLTKDIDLNPVRDSDGNPETFDVYCKNDPFDLPSLFELTATGDPGPDVTPPTTPGGDATYVPSDFTSSSINVRWTPSTDEGSGVKEYRVRCGDQEFIVPAGTLSKLFTGFQKDSEIFCYVSAIDNAGNESQPLELFFVTSPGPSDSTAPSNPAGLTAAPAGSCVTLRWTAATDNVGVTGYDVYNGAVLVTSVTGTTATICGLTANTSYTFRVVAKDAAGNKSSGATVTVKVMFPPPPVTTPTTPLPTTPTSGPAYVYTLAGSATLKTLTKGTLPLKGGINAALTLSTGAFVADLTLDQTQGRLTALGFLPVTAKIGFIPSGKTTGRLLDGVLTTNSKVRIKVQEVKLFGAIPLVGGNNCQTKQLSDINLKSTQVEFSPLVGGPLAGTFKISDLNGCGALNGLVSPLTAGSGNTIALNLTPRR